MPTPKKQESRWAWLYLLSMTLRRLGLFVAVLAVGRYGLAALQGNLAHATVATIERASLRGASACVVSDIDVFKLMNARRLRGMSEDEIRATHQRQCEGATTSGGNVTLVLAWNDHEMKEHKTSHLVSSSTADKLIEGGRLRRDAVRIRYSSTNPEGTVVLMEEIDASQRDSLYLLAASVLAIVLGVAGGLVFRAQSR